MGNNNIRLEYVIRWITLEERDKHFAHFTFASSLPLSFDLDILILPYRVTVMHQAYTRHLFTKDLKSEKRKRNLKKKKNGGQKEREKECMCVCV